MRKVINRPGEFYFADLRYFSMDDYRKETKLGCIPTITQSNAFKNPECGTQFYNLPILNKLCHRPVHNGALSILSSLL